jgi:hypothetical protein
MTFGTIEKILARCDEDADCMIWLGCRGQTNQPKTGNGSVRRIAWTLVNGEIPAKRLVTVTCGHSMCLNPDHLALTTKSAVIRKVLSRLDVKVRKTASSRRSTRASLGKITMEIARDIRASDKLGRDWARELGVSESLVSLVKRGKTWKEPANMWAGLAR